MLKKTFHDDVIATDTMEDVPPELILNWNQTGIKIVPCSISMDHGTVWGKAS